MKISIDTSAEKLWGDCPSCGEPTEAGDSCCSAGAIVEGDLVNDEDGQHEKNNPTVYIVLAKDIEHDLALEFRRILDDIGLKHNCMYSGTMMESWCVGAHVPLSNIRHTKVKDK